MGVGSVVVVFIPSVYHHAARRATTVAALLKDCLSLVASSPARFFDMLVSSMFKGARIDDPALQFKGKTIRVTGVVNLKDNRPRIEVDDPGQIEVG
jgi:hypothetical protein